MSEKRFKKMDKIIDPFPIWDTVEEKGYNCTDTLDVLVGLLNEQQATITHLEKVNGKNFAKRRLLEQDNLVLRNENEHLRQANKTLAKNLQDEEEENASDYNALYEENEQLQKELAHWKHQAEKLAKFKEWEYE